MEISSTAAATAIRAGKDAYTALELLEIGRGVIATSPQDMRADVQKLKQKDPNLAQRFFNIRDELNTPSWRRNVAGEDGSQS